MKLNLRFEKARAKVVRSVQVALRIFPSIRRRQDEAAAQQIVDLNTRRGSATRLNDPHTDKPRLTPRRQY